MPEIDIGRAVISGDIADSALPEEYAHATKLPGALQVPFVAIPGNHERRPLIRETFPDPAYGTADCALNTLRRIDGLDILLIDSTVAGAPHGSLTKRRVRRPHDLRSSFCIILRSTLELRTQTPRGSETPTRLPQFLDDTRAYCWSRQDMFIVRLKLGSRAFRPVSARGRAGGYPRPRWPEVFRIEPPAFHLHAWLPGPGFGSVVTHLVPVGEFPGPHFLRLRRNDPTPV